METGAGRWRVLEVDPTSEGEATTTEPRRHGDASDGGEASLRLSTPGLLAAALAVGLVGIAICLIALGPTPAATIGAEGSRPAAVVSAIETPSAPDGVGAASVAAPADGADILVVDVAGSVRKPGIYRLPAGARVADAVAAAGGFGPRVDTRRADLELNLAARVSDGERIRVPSRDDRGPSATDTATARGMTGTAASSRDAGGPIDLNSASAGELDSLPGVGPVTAAKIVAGRDKARYASVDDLVTRKIVGAATVAKFRDRVVAR